MIEKVGSVPSSIDYSLEVFFFFFDDLFVPMIDE
jgi:hypothetical protein